MTLTLRDRLRHDTAPDHAAAALALEATGCLDQPDPRAFLAIQAQSLLARPPAAHTDDPEKAPALRLHRRLSTALRHDLGTLPAAVRGTCAGPLSPTGFVYVALGATAGVALLAQRWPGQARFFDLMANLGDDWTALAARLAEAPATGQRAEQAVAAARTVFAALVTTCGAAGDPITMARWIRGNA
jgi:heme oxygenase